MKTSEGLPFCSGMYVYACVCVCARVRISTTKGSMIHNENES